jgi:hypothetical protein
VGEAEAMRVGKWSPPSLGLPTPLRLRRTSRRGGGRLRKFEIWNLDIEFCLRFDACNLSAKGRTRPTARNFIYKITRHVHSMYLCLLLHDTCYMLHDNNYVFNQMDTHA